MSLRPSSVDRKGVERLSIHGPGPPSSKTLNVQSQVRHDRNYKLIQDTLLGGKETIRRYDGHIPGHPKYDVKLPLSDPRPIHLQFKYIADLDLVVPLFTIDNNIIATPPKREVSIFDLNDNVNKTFLEQMASKMGVVDDLMVFYHPYNRKHLGIGMVVFHTSSDATKFVTQFNGKPVMGSIINCCLDPYFAYLSKRYEGQTGTECPTPIHLRGLDERFLLLKRNEICMANTGGAMEKILPSKEGCEENADMDMESPSSQPRGNVQVGPDVETSTPSPRCITSLGPVPITSLHSRTPQVAALTQSSEIRQDRSYIRPQFSQLALPPATIPYLPPPPYSMSLPCSGFPPSYDTPEPLLDDIASSSRRGRTPPDEKNKDRRRSLSHERSRSKDRGRDHRRKRKRRRRGSSQSSSSDSNSSLNSGEYLRVEKKEKSLKYISRERKGREKTIVQEIKTVTKKYKRTEAKRNESRATSGLQEISSDESTEEERIPRKKSHKSDKNIEKKCDGHRWSSTSSDSEERKKTRRTDKRDHLRRDSTRQLPGFEMGTTTPSYLGSSEFTNTQSAGLATSNFPPPNYHVATPPIGYTAFNPHLPPPSINPSLQCSNFNHAISKSPAVALRFVEASPPRAHQSLEDRVASLFGKKTESKVFGSQENLRTIPHISEVYSSRNNCCDETEDMDVEVDSDISPESEEQRKIRLEKEREFEQRRMKSLSLEVCAQVRADLRKELRDVLVKDLHKKIEIAAFEAMEGAWLRRRTEIEEKKRNQARENLRAELAVNVNNNSSQKSDSFPVIQQTSSSNLDITKFREELHSPEKLANIPGFGSIFSMPRLPSFRRKIRPPSPKCMESSRSESASDASGDDSDVAHKSTTASQATDSSDDLVLVKRRKRTRTRSLDSSGECSSSSHNESESEKCSDVVSTTAVEKNESTRSKTSTSISLSTTDSEESEVQEDSVVITDQPMFSDVSCSSVALKPSDIPTIDELLEWHESIPRSSYHIHYTEHCYASTLLTPEKQIENSVSTIMKKTRKQIVQSVVKRPPAKKISPKGKPIAVRKGKRIETELTSLLPPSIIVREKRLDVSSSTFFPKRSPYDQRNILYGWESGFDIEDQNYLREAWANLQPVGGPLPPWRRCIPFNSVSWEVTPKLLDRPSRIGRLDIYYDDPELEGIAPHDKGCARAQGYYKLSVKEKRRLIRRPEEGHQDKTDISERDETAVRHHVQANKESRSMHRRLLTTMGDTNTDFFKVNQLKYRKKMIKFARSRIHGWGLYALEPIAPDDMIVEYVGQKVRPTVADEREKAYERRGIGSSYLFRIDDTCVIDATKMGNFARFINHSCQPNCYAKVVTVDGDRRIVIYSKTLINKGDEITYDYKFPIEDDKIDCLCGAPNCRGTLN